MNPPRGLRAKIWMLTFLIFGFMALVLIPATIGRFYSQRPAPLFHIDPPPANIVRPEQQQYHPAPRAELVRLPKNMCLFPPHLDWLSHHQLAWLNLHD
jgi:hypothetical protein